MMKFNHPYHLVSLSPWPLFSSFSVMIMMSSLLFMFSQFKFSMMLFAYMLLIMNLYQWWRDIIRESTIQGFHTFIVIKGLQNGMILFILSEIMFFVSFFWCYFHMYLSPSIDIGSNWYPSNLIVFNPYNIPLLNTLILLSSGITITYCHYSLMESNFKESINSMLLTIILGLIFSYFQYMEYNESFFSINDSIYGSIFFLLTGFHGLHVMIGTMFNLIMYFRMNKLHFSSYHMFGFEASSWYWHFVDLVWLFLYLFVYWLIF
uniref:cytochrome c oxidase subunit III n=1 Tax=Apanteles gelechiidivoris TaxID=1911542 RepID=UPI00286AE0BA|nr:cytochrome c oxidase subunit III [Apanteles gelechiidivoris]WKW91668.1 cytochrome c oxidase subunit 3 [Apanteles gelechiidivoris]WLN31486.1 cytochrome c oxidase subunit 3 [Apanteles gelechiidivoris]